MEAWRLLRSAPKMFPISRDPPEGGTSPVESPTYPCTTGFQFLGIPPKGELHLGVLGGGLFVA